MKTVIIYDDVCSNPIQFFVVDGDYSHLNLVYINQTEDESLLDQLNAILFDEKWNYKVEFLDAFPVEEVINGAKVIVCGFAP
jgi:hypothetical protein